MTLWTAARIVGLFLILIALEPNFWQTLALTTGLFLFVTGHLRDER